MYQIDSCLILFFILITIGEFIKYLIKSEKAWLHNIFLFHFAQNMSLNKFGNFKQILITRSVFKLYRCILVDALFILIFYFWYDICFKGRRL